MNQALAIRASPMPRSNSPYQSSFYPSLSNTFHAENKKTGEDQINYSKVKYRVVEGRPLVTNNVVASKEMRKYTLEYRVNKIMQATNWKPMGGVAVINNGREIMLTQAMYRKSIPVAEKSNSNNVNRERNTRRNGAGGRRKTLRR